MMMLIYDECYDYGDDDDDDDDDDNDDENYDDEDADDDDYETGVARASPQYDTH